MSDAEAIDSEVSTGPGPMLRRARELRGLTEQQAAERLNLDVSLVGALERDDLAALGAPVFAKGHLRRYGAMLGLVEDELFAAYERAGVQPDVPTLVPRARREMMPVRGRPKWPWVLGGALLFLLAAGVATYVLEDGFQWSTDVGTPAGAEPRAESGVAGTSERGATPAAMAAATRAMTPTEESAQAAATPPAGAGQQALRPVPPGHVSINLAFATDSWAEVYDGSGQPVLYDLGRVGTQRSIAAAAPLSITIGNAPGVALMVNGRPATIPAVPGGGTVARFTIEADGTVR